MGKKQFSEFKNEKKLSNRVLTDTLKFMEDNNLIVKKTFENDPKTEYQLTSKGFNLNKILYMMFIYGLEEVNSGNFDEKTKTELKNEYLKILDLNNETKLIY